MSYPVDYLLPNFMGSYGWLQHLRLLITKNTVSRSATRNDLPVVFALLIAFIFIATQSLFQWEATVPVCSRAKPRFCQWYANWTVFNLSQNKPILLVQVWELSAKTQISAAGKHSMEREKLRGKEYGGTKKKRSTCFSSASNTRKTYGAHSHAATTCLGHLIVNTASGCSRQALGLNTVIPPCFCTLFWRRTSQCSKSFESERFTMTVMWTVNRGQMFDHCGCASKWERVSVNGSQVGLVCWRHEKPVGHLKLCMYGLTFFLNCCCNPKQWHTLQYGEGGHFTEEKYQLSWKWKFVRKWSQEHIGTQFNDVAVRDLDFRRRRT